MSSVTKSVTTFDQIFGWLFNNPLQPLKGLRVIHELAVSEIEQGAIEELKAYCKMHNLPLDIENTRENEICIKVTV